MDSNKSVNVPRITGLPLPGQVWAVWVLLLLYVLLFVLTHLFSSQLVGSGACEIRPFGTAYDCALFWFGWKDNLRILQGDYWRLLTATFLHGGVAHLFMNGFSLYILGPDSERIFGTPRFLALYLLSGLSGSVASYAFNPAPAVGASGAIFGLFGGLAVFFLTTRPILGSFGKSQLQGIAVILVVNLLFGFANAGVIDNFGHLGGLLGGFVAAWMLVPRYEVDRASFPPRIIRRTNPLAWAGVVVMLVVLAVLTLLIVPPPFR
jgi:rhomboid protease GluP